MSGPTKKETNEQTPSPVIIGVSSLLVIFSVLCLTVFAMLSLVTARANDRLLERQRIAVLGRAEAEAEAERTLAGIRAGDVPEGVARDGDLYTFTCRISDTAYLEVRAEVSGPDYRILTWQEKADINWENDETIDVWQEEDFPGMGGL